MTHLASHERNARTHDNEGNVDGDGDSDDHSTEASDTDEFVAKQKNNEICEQSIIGSDGYTNFTYKISL